MSTKFAPKGTIETIGSSHRDPEVLVGVAVTAVAISRPARWLAVEFIGEVGNLSHYVVVSVHNTREAAEAAARNLVA